MAAALLLPVCKAGEGLSNGNAAIGKGRPRPRWEGHTTGGMKPCQDGRAIESNYQQIHIHARESAGHEEQPRNMQAKGSAMHNMVLRFVQCS